MKINNNWKLYETKARGENKKKIFKCSEKQKPEYCKNLSLEKTLDITKLGEWTTFKVGIKKGLLAI